MNQPIPIPAVPRANRIEQRIYRVRRFDQNGNMTDLIAVLRAERFNGTCTLHMCNGGIMAVTVEDSRPITAKQLDI